MEHDECAVCGGGAVLVRERRDFRIGRIAARVDQEFFRCERCGEEHVHPEQASAIAEAALAELHARGLAIYPHEIRALRERHRLSRRQLEVLLGVGENTVIRWEERLVYPNATTAGLLRLLLSDPSIVRALAKLRRIDLHSDPGSKAGTSR